MFIRNQSKIIVLTLCIMMALTLFAHANTFSANVSTDVVAGATTGGATGGATGGTTGSASGDVSADVDIGTSTGGSSNKNPVSGTCGENVTWTFENGILTVSGTGDMGDWGYFLNGNMTRPDYFDFADDITEIVVEEGVTNIGRFAFAYFKNLTKATIPSSVKLIKQSAFYNCGSVKITLSEGLEKIESNAFYGCSSIFPVTIPASVTKIESGAFGDATENAKIMGYSSTEAEYFASEYGFEFESLGDAPKTEVYVKNGAELIDAIGINKKIILKDGIYTIFDSLKINNVYNLEITAENPGYAEILSYDGYKPVIEFKNSSDIKISGLILGHRYIGYSWGCGSSASSSGDVIYSYGSDDILIDYCDLYGCGTVGVRTYETPNLKITNSLIRDCSERIMYANYVEKGEFILDNCIMYGNGYGIDSGIASESAYESAFYTNHNISIKNSMLFRNYNPEFFTGSGSFSGTDCKILHNSWQNDVTANAYGICLNGITWQIVDDVLMLGYDLELSDDVVIKSTVGKVLPYSYSSLPWFKYDYNSVVLAEGVEYDDVIWCTCGDSAEWEYYDGKLTISGRGELYAMEYSVPINGSTSRSVYSPWQKFNDKITDIEISDDVRGLQKRAFEDTAYYKTLDGNEKYIGNHLISVEKLSGEYKIKDGTKSIADRAAEYKSMTSLIIPEGVKTIGNYQEDYTYTFGDCSRLESVTLPSTLTHINSYAFAYCNNIQTVFFNGTKEQWDNIYINENNTSILNASVYGKDFSILPPSFEYEVTGDGCATVTMIKENVVDAVIPETIDGYPVTSISSYAFNYNTKLKSIKIDAKITSISEVAFLGCTSLESIILPNTITSIGKNAFNDTAFYKNSSNWDNGILYIGNYLISAKNSVKGEVNVKNGTTVIASYAFTENPGITGITLTDSLTHIGICGLYGLSSIENLILPENIILEKEDAWQSPFEKMSSLKSITLPATYTEMKYELNWCHKLENIFVADSNEVFTAKDGILYTKDMSTLVYYPYGKTTKSYTIPDSVTKIGTDSITNSFIETLTIPASVTVFEGVPIIECNMLSRINYNGTEEQWNLITFDDYFYNRLISSYSIYGTDFTYLVEGVKYEETENGYILKKIASYVKELTIPKTYKGKPVIYTDDSNSSGTVSDNPFSSAVNLEKITVEDGHEYFTAVDNVLFNKDMTKIIKYAPKKDDKEYIIPESVKEIGSGAFEFAILEKLILPQSMTALPDGAFEYVYDLKEIVLPDGIKSIGAYALSGCSSLEKINLPEGLESIGNSAFSDCSSLKNITIPNTVTSIGTYAFSWCNSLKEIVIPDSVTELGQNAFYGNKALIAATIGSGVSAIPYSAFYNCTSLLRITIGTNLLKIGDYAFYNCDSLQSVYYIGGTNEDFNNISIDGYMNYRFTNARRKFLDEMPKGPAIKVQNLYKYSQSEDGTVGIGLELNSIYCEDAITLMIGFDSNGKTVAKDVAENNIAGIEGKIENIKIIAIESFESMKPLCKAVSKPVPEY